MLISVKILKGDECTIEVSATASINSVKELVAQQLQIPVDQQRLVFKGKTLLDSESLCDYNIVEGNKLHLFVREDALQQNSPKSFHDKMQTFLEKHFSPSDAKIVLDELQKNISSNVSKLSLDDIERLALGHLDSNGEPQQQHAHFSQEKTST